MYKRAGLRWRQAGVHAADPVHRGELIRIGFIKQDDDLVKPLNSIDDPIKILALLTEPSALFAIGRD